MPIYTIGYGEQPDRAFLSTLATSSGGRALFAPTSADLRTAFEELGLLLRRQYVVRFAPGVAPATRTLHLIMEVTAVGGSGIVELDFENPIPARPVVAVNPAATAGPPAAPVVVPVAVGQTPGSSSPQRVLLPGLAAIILSGLVVLSVRRLRRRPDDLEQFDLRGSHEDAAPEIVAAGAVSRRAGMLTVVAGPRTGQQAPIGDRVVSIGQSADCPIVLPARYEEIASEHARIWWHGGRLILHSLDPTWPTRLGGASVEWVRLHAGDVLEIGPYMIAVDEGPDQTSGASSTTALSQSGLPAAGGE